MRKLDSHEIACYVYKNGLMDKADSLQYSKLIMFNEMLVLDKYYAFNLATMIWALSSADSFEKIFLKLDDIVKKEIY